MLDDARWNERLAAYVLIAGILVIGLAPQWLSSLIDNSWNALSIQP